MSKNIKVNEAKTSSIQPVETKPTRSLNADHALQPNPCPQCNGQTEFNGSGGISCFFCGYDELAEAQQ